MGQVIEVSLDEQGRIVIPSSLKNRLELLPGVILVVEKGDKDEVYLRVQVKPPTLVDKQGVLVVRAEPFGNLVNITRNERDRRVFELLQRVGL